MWNVLLGSLAALSLAITLWQWLAARLFPLRYHPFPPASNWPGITVLKPLKGIDSPTRQALESWFQQVYPGPLQLLFGVASPNDPARTEVECLIQQYPHAHAQCVLCPDQLGPNAKVSTLAQLHRHSAHPHIVISDADVWVPPDFLQHFTRPLENPKIGLVTAFYQLPSSGTLAMKWEAVSVNSDFWTQVLQARCLKPIDFGLGAAMATTRFWIDKIGGFHRLLPFLADDYQLGHFIFENGGAILLSSSVVECRSKILAWSEVWTHQLRWTRTIRICQPLPFFFSIIANPLLWPLLWLLLVPSASAAIFFFIALLVRIATARSNFKKLTQSALPFRDSWIVPLKDLLQAALWTAAFSGNVIVWRGDRFKVLSNGKLQPLTTALPAPPPSAHV